MPRIPTAVPSFFRARLLPAAAAALAIAAALALAPGAGESGGVVRSATVAAAGAAGADPVSEAVATAPALSEAVAPLASPGRRPSGVLTFTTEGGVHAAVRAADPSVRIAPPLTEPVWADSAEVRPDVYPSPNGRFIATVRRDQEGTSLDVTTGAVRVASFLLAAPDGDQLVNGAKGTARAVAGVPLTVAWSPDSRYLAFGSIIGSPWGLYVITAGDWRTERHRIWGGYAGELAWSPDSELLAISTYEIDRSDHSVLIFDSSVRRVRYLIDGCLIVWAPDGDYIALHREPKVEPGVWIASADGEDRIRVTADPTAVPLVWTP